MRGAALTACPAARTLLDGYMSVKRVSGPARERLLGEIAAWLKAMADPTRLRILHALQAGERCVTELLADLACSQANVSKHLSVLKAAGLVDCRRDGVNVYYRIVDPTVFTICEAVCNSIQRDLDVRRAGLAKGRAFVGEGARG